MVEHDVIIVGAGASGLMAASTALKNGHSVAILEMGATPARKVAISGGGDCNITNTAASFDRYFSNNPQFVRSALAQFSPHDMLLWAQEHNLNLYEKTTGKYFCANGANTVVNALMQDVKNADIYYETCVNNITKEDGIFYIHTNKDKFCAKSVIIATGGISFPSLGVSDTGYKIAKQFGHKIIPVQPALCMIAIKDNPYAEFSGIALPAEITIGKHKVSDDLLFTHIGIGGPAAYRASLYDLHNGLTLNLLPNIDLNNVLMQAKQTFGNKTVTRLLSEHMPTRIAKYITKNDSRNIADLKNTEIEQIVSRITNIHISADNLKLHSMASAEVVLGGISTDNISSKTMESLLCSGLYFTGEVIDITGDLGGFNLHWAWASGFVAGKNA